MSKRVRFNNPISTTSGGGGLSNLGLIFSSLMPRTFCSSDDDSMYCILGRILGFIIMFFVLLFIVRVVYKVATGKMKLFDIFNMG